MVHQKMPRKIHLRVSYVYFLLVFFYNRRNDRFDMVNNGVRTNIHINEIACHNQLVKMTTRVLRLNLNFEIYSRS